MSVKKYFAYELKKSIFAIASIALIMTAITVTAILTHRYEHYGRVESGIGTVSVMVGLLAAVVPVFMLSYKMKKRSVDLYYSLPLRRGQILRVKYLIGLIAVYAPYTVAFFLGALAAVIRFDAGAMAGEYYFAAYFASLPAIFCIYGLASFVFTRAERIIDGIAFIVFCAFAIFAVMAAVQRIEHRVAADMFLPFEPLSAVAGEFKRIIEWPNIYISDNINITINRAIGSTVTGLLTVAATVMLFVTERGAKVENIGGVSDSPFGYKVMIPLFTVCIIANLDIVGSVAYIYLAVIVVGAAFMLSALYKHTFKIGKTQSIVLSGSVVLGVALSIALSYISLEIYGI